MLFAVLLVVFTQAFDLGDRVVNYPMLLLFNIVLFSVLPRGDHAGRDVDRQPGVGRPQDPVPARW